jgi:hypothetical protein
MTMQRKSRLPLMFGGLVTAAAVTFAVLASSYDAASATVDDAAVSVTSDAVARDVEAQYAEGVVAITLGDVITVSGYGASVDGSTVTIDAAGVYSISGTLTDGQIVVDADGKVYLEFDGVVVTSSSGPALLISDAEKVTLTLMEGTSNSLVDPAGSRTYDAALYTNDTLVMNGKGSLAVIGNSQKGIASDDDLVINAGTMVVTSVGDGLSAHDGITITGGSTYVVAGDDALVSKGDIDVNGGTLVALGHAGSGHGGLIAADAVTITGGTVIATGSSMTAPCEESTQLSLYVSTGSIQAADTSISVTRGGEKILVFAPDVPYQNVLVSSDDLVAGAAYDVYVGSDTVPITAVAAIIPAGIGATDAAAAITELAVAVRLGDQG